MNFIKKHAYKLCAALLLACAVFIAHTAKASEPEGFQITMRYTNALGQERFVAYGYVSKCPVIVQEFPMHSAPATVTKVRIYCGGKLIMIGRSTDGKGV